jgi:predicted secreted Zn-dependent protease
VSTSGSELTWIRSRRCESHACVEVAATPDSILVRNSTDPDGRTLRFTRAEWVAFLGGVRDGDFNFGLIDEHGQPAR